ncbi:MAG: plasmid pRiA4b ORF-3 family protein [Kiritimatiellae bacterium]|jgi:hypothetical protein|nr:plasmid pRiA4b ORF-3 family protein [Kiritimatiellia bacterium]
MSKKKVNGIRVKLSLQYSEPKIWREVCLPFDVSFAELHDIIQILMDWDDYHLHQFKHNGLYIGDPKMFEEFGDRCIDEKEVVLGDVFQRKGSKCEYEYDFGDSWGVDVVSQGKMKEDDDLFTVIGGEMAAPPEDCGGIPGFYNMIEVLSDPKHPDYDELYEWMGEKDFDPKEFNIELCNIAVGAIGKRRAISIVSDNTSDKADISLDGFMKKFISKLHEENWDEIDDRFFEKVMDELFDDYSRLSQKDAAIAMMQIKDLLDDADGLNKEEAPIVKKRIIFVRLEKSEYLKIPMLNMIKFLVSIIQKEGRIKLTGIGALPPKYVKELYALGYIKDPMIEDIGYKVSREDSVLSIQLARILFELSDIVKKKSNMLTLTKKGEKIIADDSLLFTHIIDVYVAKFNWGYFDRHDEELDEIGQRDFTFTFILLDLFGDEFRPMDFYAEEYLRYLKDSYNIDVSGSRFASMCYATRSFERFLAFFGLVDMKSSGNNFVPDQVKASELFKKLIIVEDV